MKERTTLAIILSSIAIFFSIVALYTSRPYNWALDFVGVIISVLTLLVTLLVGWNIYTVVDFKREIEDVKKETETKLNDQKEIFERTIKRAYFDGLRKVGHELMEMKNRIDKGEALLQANISTSLAASLNSSIVENEFLFISHSIKAVIPWANASEYSNASTNITFLIKVLDPQQVTLRESQIKSLNEMVNKIPNSHKIDNIDTLYDYISKLTPKR